METKKCQVCQKSKDLEEFRRLTGLKNKFNKICRGCIAPARKRAEENKERLKEYQKQYRADHKEYFSEYRRAWKAQNPELNLKYKNDAYQNDPDFKRRTLTRQRLRGLIAKGFEFEMEIGCSFDVFKTHIESLWLPGMSWNNYGKTAGCWSIDHKEPLNGNELKNPNHYTNLQPLWVEDNSAKGDKAPSE